MKNINRDVAFNFYMEKLKKMNVDDILSEIKTIFYDLSDAQLSKVLSKNNINLLREVGIDEEKLNHTIGKINSGEYYIQELISYNNSYYYDDYDSLYSDPFDIISVLEEAIEYCYILYGSNQLNKAYSIGHSILTLNIAVCSITEYDDTECFDECLNIVDAFSVCDSEVDTKKFMYLMLAVILKMEYSFKRICWILNMIDYMVDDFINTLLFIDNKESAKEKIFKALTDNFNRKVISYKILPSLLDFVGDDKLYKEYAYRFNKHISPILFESYYEFVKSKGDDTSQIIKDAVSLLMPCPKLEKFAKMAIKLDGNNDRYKIAAYKSNSNSIENFFMLYSMQDLKKIKDIINNDLHIALFTMEKEDIDKLPLQDRIYLLEVWTNKPYQCDYDKDTRKNIEIWQGMHELDIIYFTRLYENTVNMLLKKCDDILGSARSEYYNLASCVYRIDRLIDYNDNIKELILSKYKKYIAFKKDIVNIYSE